MKMKATFQNVFTGSHSYPCSLWFNTSDGRGFYLYAFKNGIMEIKPMFLNSIEATAEYVSWLCSEYSNLHGIKVIKFWFSGLCIQVTAKNASKDSILEIWKEKVTKLRTLTDKLVGSLY